MVYKFIDKKTAGSGFTTHPNKCAIKSIPQNEQLVEELLKIIIKTFKKSIFNIQRQYLGC